MNSAMRRVIWRGTFVACGLLVLGLVWKLTRPVDQEVPVADVRVQSTQQSTPSPPRIRAVRPAAPSAGFLGDAACAECHASIVDRYNTHPMSNSLTRVSNDPSLNTFDSEITFRPGGQCVYRVRKTDDSGLAHEELMFDKEGELIYERSLPIHYSLGSGVRGRSYLSSRNDVLLMSSITWYANGNRWDLSPGFVPDDPRGFSRRVIDECLACHVGRVSALPGTTNHYAADPFPQMSIGCENCHGPGGAHVQMRRSKSAGQDDPIVNPAVLPLAERESVCNQCHLQAAARIPRYGRSYFDFRPGQRLEEVLTVFLSGVGVTADGKTKSVSQVQQMMASQCFKKSDGRFGCTSCHDPHRSPQEAELVGFYRERCLKCHDDLDCKIAHSERLNHKAKNSCFECHMPRLPATDIAHTAQTDHRVLAKPEGEQASSLPGPTKPLIFFDEADKRLPEWEANRSLGLATIQHVTELGHVPDFSTVERLLLPGLEIAADDTRVLSSLVAVALKNGNLPGAEKYAQQILTHDPQNESALSAMVHICYQSERVAEGLEFANRLLKIYPWNDTILAQQADMLRLTARLPEGVAAAEQALRLNPRLLPLRRWLSNAYRDLGELEKSEEQLSIIRRIEAAPAAK